MRNFYCLLLLLAVIACNDGEKKNAELYQIQGYAQGTTFNIQYIDEENRNFQYQIDSVLSAVDQSMSTWVDSSIISRINNGPSKTYPIDSIFKEVYLLSMDIADITNGGFNVTLAPVIYEWGIGFNNPRKLSESEVDSLMRFVGYDKFEIKGMEIIKKIPEAKLDFNAVAQGYTVDLITEFLKSQGVDNLMVELGGEIRTIGKNAEGGLWRIGIDKPIHSNTDREMKAIISLDNKSLATSGNYRKFYEVEGEKYSHSIDPSTGFPVMHNLLSATVISEKAAIADAYATALMVMGLEEGKQFLEEHPEVEAYLIYSDKKGNLNDFITEGLKQDVEILQ